MRHFIVPPFQPRVHSVAWTLRQGDTLEGICEALGLSGCCYGEIVGANLERGLTSRNVAEGQALKLRGLRAGELLKLPAHWDLPLVGVSGGGSVNPGEDNKLDQIGLVIADYLHQLTGDNDKGMHIDPSNVPAIFNATSQWFRQDTDDGAAPPNWPDFKPYVLAAQNWHANYGFEMQAIDRDHLAWTLFPWWSGQKDLQLFKQKPIAWGLVRNWANAHIKPGMVKSKPEPAHSDVSKAWRTQDFGKQPWKSTPWSLPFSQIPAWAIPWGYLQPTRLLALPQGSTPEQNAAALILDISDTLGLPYEEEAAPAPKTAPGGRPDAVYGKAGGKKKPRPGTGARDVAPEPAKKSPVIWYIVGAGGVLIALTLAGWVVLSSPGKD